MQEVTRVRALEGEIARTIQSINGISAARVHIVMADRGNFRRGEQQPSASVMVRTGTTLRRARPIRSGTSSHPPYPASMLMRSRCLTRPVKLLATGDDFSNSNLNRSLSIVQLVQNESRDKHRKGAGAVSWHRELPRQRDRQVNTDSQQVQETIFDPESRVERSTRVTRENQTSNQSATETPATVEQNIPDQGPGAGGAAGPQSSELAERKEEQTNYEINSKVVSTVRNSYMVEGLSIAVVVNQGQDRRHAWWCADT
jgi:flagellar M-ring protein FliF